MVCFPFSYHPRADIAWWNNTDQSVFLMELTVCFDTLFHEAATRMKTNTRTSLSAIHKAGYRANLITMDVGAQKPLNILNV